MIIIGFVASLIINGVIIFAIKIDIMTFDEFEIYLHQLEIYASNVYMIFIIIHTTIRNTNKAIERELYNLWT